MLKISKRAQYGLRAMVFLAKNYKQKKISSVKLISKNEDIPFEFLEKIIRQLADAGLVNGEKGIHGGYILAKPPKNISTNDVVSVLEESKKPVDCALCGRKSKCLTKNVWAKVEKTLNKTLKSITLENLIS